MTYICLTKRAHDKCSFAQPPNLTLLFLGLIFHQQHPTHQAFQRIQRPTIKPLATIQSLTRAFYISRFEPSSRIQHQIVFCLDGQLSTLFPTSFISILLTKGHRRKHSLRISPRYCLSQIGCQSLCRFCVLLSILPALLVKAQRATSREKTGKMPTSKRKMNRKRWKQPKIIGKRYNDRLGVIIAVR